MPFLFSGYFVIHLTTNYIDRETHEMGSVKWIPLNKVALGHLQLH